MRKSQIVTRARRWAKWLLGALAAWLIGFGCFLYFEVYYANGEIVSSGTRRTYLLHAPANLPTNQPVPLVICFHGFSEWPRHVMRLSHWNKVADEEGFLVVYPCGSGFPLRWRCFSWLHKSEEARADVVFIGDLIGQLRQQYRIDDKRIYANGISNGGGMSFLLAGQLSDQIAAFGGVAGAYMLPWKSYRPKRAVPAMIFHGTDDLVVPFHGKDFGKSRVLPDIPKWVGMLAQRNGCETNAVALPPKGCVSGVSYQAGTSAADVVFYTVAGGGHTWPGGKKMPFFLGKTTADIDATRLMWEFFKAHPLTK